MLLAGKQDLNNASSLTIENYLLEKDPLRAGTDARQKYTALARRLSTTVTRSKAAC